MISVLLPTKDEEVNLPYCLESLEWCDDIVVLDSFSTDRTVEIARASGARVIQRPFDNWGAHLNWAHDNISFRYPWLYYCDADETVPNDLRDEMRQIAGDGSCRFVAYRLRYKNFFMGRWIKHCGIYPVWLLRFYRPDRVRWARSVHQVAEVDGPEGRIESHLLHYSFRKGLTAWFDKHNRYSSDEANESIQSLSHSNLDWRGIVQFHDWARRRRALKELSFRLPCRPMLRFLYMYFLRLGYLDGLAGYHYCRLLSNYEYMIVLKINERHSNWDTVPLTVASNVESGTNSSGEYVESRRGY